LIISTQQDSRQLDCLDASTKAVHQAVLEGRDIFKECLASQIQKTDVMHNETNALIVGEASQTRIDVIETISTSNDQDRFQHESTRQEILQLRQALEQYRLDMEQRSTELKSLLVTFEQTSNPQKREKLQEKSKAVTAALYALKVVYDSLQVSSTRLLVFDY
jgi:hypothetical protein